MTRKMLIDAAHAEETRVVVLDGTKVEEFDFESQARKQLRGNIYLAKVTRVEPSLQAAFVEYGGNRHGFLAFNEIHPDYFQIPHADREALMREAAEEDDENGERDAPECNDLFIVCLIDGPHQFFESLLIEIIGVQQLSGECHRPVRFEAGIPQRACQVAHPGIGAAEQVGEDGRSIGRVKIIPGKQHIPIQLAPRIALHVPVPEIRLCFQCQQ